MQRRRCCNCQSQRCRQRRTWRVLLVTGIYREGSSGVEKEEVLCKGGCLAAPFGASAGAAYAGTA